jgi:hypothetical protein
MQTLSVLLHAEGTAAEMHPTWSWEFSTGASNTGSTTYGA